MNSEEVLLRTKNANVSFPDELEKSQQCNVIRSCSNCQYYEYEEVGDSDFGAIYSDEATCSKHIDYDEEKGLDIPDFDRTIERECCELDFFKVLEIDNFLNASFSKEIQTSLGKFNETHELFKKRYNLNK